MRYKHIFQAYTLRLVTVIQRNVQHHIWEICNILENFLFTVILTFANCLKRQIKYFFNPLAKIILIRNSRKKHQEPSKDILERKDTLIS